MGPKMKKVVALQTPLQTNTYTHVKLGQAGRGGAERGGAGQAKPGLGPSVQQHCPQI